MMMMKTKIERREISIRALKQLQLHNQYVLVESAIAGLIQRDPDWAQLLNNVTLGHRT